MTSLLTPEAKPLVVPLTVDQYHEMIRLGILEEGSPIELIDGMLIRKDRRDHSGGIMTVGPKHVFCLQKIMQLLSAATSMLPGHIRLQQPISILPSHEPEPDLCLVRGTLEDYRDQHPVPQDVLLIVEVADSSLGFDMGRKLELYASCGIPYYWVVNLRQGTVEAFWDPTMHTETYAKCEVLHSSGLATFELQGQVISCRVSEIFGLDPAVD